MPAIIAWVLAGLSTLFASRIGQWVVSALVFLGIEFATKSFVADPIMAQIRSVASGVGGDAAGWLAFFNIDKYITLIVSAYVVAGGKSMIMRKRGAPA